MYVCMYVYVYVCMHVYMYVYVFVYVFVYMYVYVYVYMYVYMYVHMYVRWKRSLFFTYYLGYNISKLHSHSCDWKFSDELVTLKNQSDQLFRYIWLKDLDCHCVWMYWI